MTAKLSMICSKQSNDTYFAICPEVRGCFTQGDTYEEAVSNLRELVELTIKEDLTADIIQSLINTKSKIFSEFEVFVQAV
jgi:predicted RNase H-like HicB family nuclease